MKNPLAAAIVATTVCLCQGFATLGWGQEEAFGVQNSISYLQSLAAETRRKIQSFGVDPGMVREGAVRCAVSGAAGCAGYAAARYIENLGKQFDGLAAEADSINPRDPQAQFKLNRIQGQIATINRRIDRIETGVEFTRNTAIGCVAGGPAGCARGAAESAGWFVAEKYAPPGYAKTVAALKAVRGVQKALTEGAIDGVAIPGGAIGKEVARGWEGASLALSREAAVKAVEMASQFDKLPSIPQPIRTAFGGPGGISLSKAAAQRMALNLDVDSAFYRNGVLFLSGKKSKERVDASLFLTAMRLACDSSGDPYFSLDPPDPAAWDEQSELILKLAGRQIKTSHKGGYSFDSFPFSSQKYPALKSELVFRPQWLRDTRFGEIMYEADVLLKEISVGQSVVNPERPFRGKRVPDYVSTLRRSLDMEALDGPEGSDAARNVRGFRLWFDLTTTGDRSNEAASSVIYTNGGVLDLSAIQPRMYVRRHEGGEDLPGSDPANDQVASDVNARTALYAESFDELRELTAVFRAYVAALKVANDNASVCSTVQQLPLSPGEEIEAPLPAYRDAIVHRAVKRTTSGRMLYTRTNMMVSGGIGMRGRRLYETRAIEKETPISTTLRQEVERGVTQPAWERDGRQYVALSIDPREPPPRAPITASSK